MNVCFLKIPSEDRTKSRTHALSRYYYYIHNGIDTRYVAGINQRWFRRIMTMVPREGTPEERVANGLGNKH